MVLHNLRVTETFEGKEIYKSLLELNCLEVYNGMHFAYDCTLSISVFV